jgi:glycerophosphoryl diester phosphodiesterase
VPFAAFGSFDHDTVRDLAAAQREYPRFPIAVLVGVGEDPFAAAADTGAEIVDLCWERASDAPDRLVTPDLLVRAAQEGLVVVIRHEERRTVLNRLLTRPVIGICTDKPEMMNRLRAASGLSHRCRLSPRLTPAKHENLMPERIETYS